MSDEVVRSRCARRAMPHLPLFWTAGQAQSGTISTPLNWTRSLIYGHIYTVWFCECSGNVERPPCSTTCRSYEEPMPIPVHDLRARTPRCTSPCVRVCSDTWDYRYGDCGRLERPVQVRFRCASWHPSSHHVHIESLPLPMTCPQEHGVAISHMPKPRAQPFSLSMMSDRTRHGAMRHTTCLPHAQG